MKTKRKSNDWISASQPFVFLLSIGESCCANSHCSAEGNLHKYLPSAESLMKLTDFSPITLRGKIRRSVGESAYCLRRRRWTTIDTIYTYIYWWRLKFFRPCGAEQSTINRAWSIKGVAPSCALQISEGICWVSITRFLVVDIR